MNDLLKLTAKERNLLYMILSSYEVNPNLSVRSMNSEAKMVANIRKAIFGENS